MNYYDLFEIKMSPVVDQGTLAKKYFELQKRYHPDFFSQATEIEKSNAEEISSNINKAFIIFKDAQKSIEYFLNQTNVLSPEEKYTLPADFLMEMMDINEDENSDQSLIRNRVAEIENDLFNEIKPLLSGTVDFAEHDLSKLKAYYYKKKYLQRILDRFAD